MLFVSRYFSSFVFFSYYVSERLSYVFFICLYITGSCDIHAQKGHMWSPFDSELDTHIFHWPGFNKMVEQWHPLNANKANFIPMSRWCQQVVHIPSNKYKLFIRIHSDSHAHIKNVTHSQCQEVMEYV